MEREGREAPVNFCLYGGSGKRTRFQHTSAMCAFYAYLCTPQESF